MNYKIAIIIFTFCNTIAAQQGGSRIMQIKYISDKINSVAFNKSSNRNDYNNIKEFEKILDASDELIEVGKVFAKNLKEKSDKRLPIKGEDLSIMSGLMRATLLIMEKSSLMTSLYNEQMETVQTPEQAVRTSLLNFLAMLNYAKLYRATYKSFVDSHSTYSVAKEVAKLIDNDKDKEILKQFTKIAKNEEFYNQLQNNSNDFFANRYGHLKMMVPDITRAVVLIEKFDLKNKVIGQKLPKISFWSLGEWFTEIFSKFTNFISGVFGNLVGKLRFRHGYLSNHAEALEILNKSLRPLDIIAEKTPFAATDFFIPGHFGHIAIYLGTQEELKAYGLWNHPSIKPLREEIKKGKTIIESIRPGSRMVSLQDFLEIDEITIIRETGLLDEPRITKQVVKVAIEQLNKPYDFNFDVVTLDKVVCSEVPYHAFGHKRWQTSYILGRSTISPDQIIENAYTQGSGIEFIMSLKANEEGEIKFVSKRDMADNLDFEYDKRKNLFTKEHKNCRLVKVHRHKNDGIGTNRSYRYYKKCKTVDQALIYSDF